MVFYPSFRLILTVFLILTFSAEATIASEIKDTVAENHKKFRTFLQSSTWPSDHGDVGR